MYLFLIFLDIFFYPKKNYIGKIHFFFLKVLLSIVEGLVPVAHGVSVPQAGIEPKSPAAEVCSLNHWTAREVPRLESDQLHKS